MICYDPYCKFCKHKELEEGKDPCNICLDAGEYDDRDDVISRKPLYFEADEKFKKKKENKHDCIKS